MSMGTRTSDLGHPSRSKSQGVVAPVQYGVKADIVVSLWSGRKPFLTTLYFYLSIRFLFLWLELKQLTAYSGDRSLEGA